MFNLTLCCFFSYVDVMKQLFKNETEMSSTKDKEKIEESFKPSTTPGSHTILSSPWSSKSSGLILSFYITIILDEKLTKFYLFSMQTIYYKRSSKFPIG